MIAAASHTGASINPNPGTAGNYGGPVTYTVTAEDGTTQTYTVTVNVAPGITIGGITNPSIQVLTLSGVPASPVSGGTQVTIILSESVTVSGWYIEMTNSAASTTASANPFSLPTVPGFYNVNVIATVGAIEYSGSFVLTVN
jgi:hypothetical protein